MSTKRKNTYKTKEVTKNTNNNEVKQLVILLAIIIAFLLIVYVISTLVKGKDYSSIFDNSLDASEIQYNEIILGTLTTQLEDEYYVLIFDDEDPYAKTFQNYVTSYLDLKYTTKIYQADLNNIFNKDRKAENSSFDKYNFYVKGTTLVKIKDHEIIESYENPEDISRVILTLTKEVEDQNN